MKIPTHIKMHEALTHDHKFFQGCTHLISRVHIYGSCMHMNARIFMTILLLVDCYLMSSILRFPYNPTFHLGNIPVFVTLYDLELNMFIKVIIFLSLKDSFLTVCWARDHILGHKNPSTKK